MKVGDSVRVRGDITDAQLIGVGINSPFEAIRTKNTLSELDSTHLSSDGRNLRASRLKESGWFVPTEWLEEISSSTTTERSKTSMVFNVTVTSVPTLRAQENGDEETIIVPSEQVVAKEQNAALLLAGANNADAINKVKGSTLRAIVQQVG